MAKVEVYGDEYKKACEQAARDANIYEVVINSATAKDLLAKSDEAAKKLEDAENKILFEIIKSNTLDASINSYGVIDYDNDYIIELRKEASEAHEAQREYAHNYFTCPTFEFKSDDLETCSLPGVELVNGSCEGIISDAKLGTIYYPGYVEGM